MIAQVKAVTPGGVRALARSDRRPTIKAADDAAAEQRKQLDAGQQPVGPH